MHGKGLLQSMSFAQDCYNRELAGRPRGIMRVLKERRLWPERGLVFECPTTHNRRQAEARLRRIVNQYRVPPAAARNLQAAIVQGTMLYASELTWNGKENVERECQLAINRMSRASVRAFRTTPRGIIMAESGFTPARALLDHRRARFAQRLIARPRGRRGPEEILDRSATITARLRRAAAIERGGTSEGQEWSEARSFPGQTVVEES